MGAVTKDLRAKLERSEERVTRWLVHRSVAILRNKLGPIEYLGCMEDELQHVYALRA